MKETTNNKAAWEKIFRELDILGHIGRHGHYDITAPQIKQHGDHREPRLMTKVDFREHLPCGRPRMFPNTCGLFIFTIILNIIKIVKVIILCNMLYISNI